MEKTSVFEKLSDKLVARFIVGVTDLLHFLRKLLFIEAEILAKIGKRRIKIAQFHIQKTQQQKRIVRNVFHKKISVTACNTPKIPNKVSFLILNKVSLSGGKRGEE